MKMLFVLITLALSSQLNAQTAETIRTGRPGQAIGANVVGRGILQWQMGLDQNEARFFNSDTTTHTMNNVIRFGLNESFELSAVLDLTKEDVEPGSSNDRSGLSQQQVGFRYNLVSSPDGWIPAIAFQTRFRLRSVSNDFRSNEVAPVHLISLVHRLTDTINLASNGGLSYDGNSPTPRFNYVFSFSQSFGDHWSACYEIYGNENRLSKNTYLGLGLAYLMNKDFQWDGYISNGNNNNVKETYISLGFSWRTWVF